MNKCPFCNVKLIKKSDLTWECSACKKELFENGTCEKCGCTINELNFDSAFEGQSLCKKCIEKKS